MTAPLMPRRIQVEWAKEELMVGIDQHLNSLQEKHMLDDLDDEVELLKQRNRIARFLNLPEKKL